MMYRRTTIKIIGPGIIVLWAFMMLTSCSKAKGPYYDMQRTNTFSGNTYDFLKAQPAGQFDSLLFIIDRIPGFKDSLQRQQDISLFAINDASFKAALSGLNSVRALQKKPPLWLATIDAPQLDTLLCRYVLTQKVVVDTLMNYATGLRYPSLHYGYKMSVAYNRNDASGYMEGGALELSFADPKNSIFTRFWVYTFTVTSGTYTTNGIVFNLTDNHIFGFGEFITRLINV